MAAALSRVYAGLCRRDRLTSKECPFWLYLFCALVKTSFRLLLTMSKEFSISVSKENVWENICNGKITVFTVKF
jgi:hypothetical protein